MSGYSSYYEKLSTTKSWGVWKFPVYRIKHTIANLLLILLVNISFLFSPGPRSGEKYCGHYIQLKSIGFYYNCDTTTYLQTAKDLGILLEENTVRQTRPIFAVLGFLVGRPIQFFIDGIYSKHLQYIDNKYNSLNTGIKYSEIIGYFVGYIIINFIVLYLILVFFEKVAMQITDGRVSNYMIYTFKYILISGKVTKAAFSNASTDFFILFTPVFAVFIMLYINKKMLNLKNIYYMSFLCGLLVLLYGNFMLLLPCILFASYLTDKSLHIKASIINTLLFVLPTLLWITFCTMYIGHYYNHEVESYRQFIWIVDKLKISLTELETSFYNNTFKYASTFVELKYFIIIAFVLFGFIKAKKTEIFISNYAYIIRILIFSFLAFFVFFWALGFYKVRLTYNLFPIVLCSVLFELSLIEDVNKWTIFIFLLAVSWHLYSIISYRLF